MITVKSLWEREHLLVNTNSLTKQRMGSKSMRVAAEAAKLAVARMRAAGENSSQASPAGDQSPAVTREQQAVPVVTSPRGDSPRATHASADTAGATTRTEDEPGIEPIYSGESDDSSNSMAACTNSVSPGVDANRARLTGSGDYAAQLREVLGSDHSSDDSSSHASPLDSKQRGDGGDALMRRHERNSSRDRAATGVSASADTNQEARDRNVLRHAPQVESPWMPPSKELDRVAGMTTKRDRIPLFDCRKLCPPNSSTKTIRAEE